MNGTKIQLSAKELQLVSDSEVILTKNRIISKVYELFGIIADEVRKITKVHQTNLPAELMRAAPKIAKGENYLGLPYVMLDYPRLFEKDDIFAVRMMFWWGNFFSTTLHLKGKYKMTYQENLVSQFFFLCDHHYYVCVSHDEWHHHFEHDNYHLISALTHKQFGNIIRGKEFVKLSAKLPLTAWTNAEQFFLESFKQMLLFPVNCPNDETDH